MGKGFNLCSITAVTRLYCIAIFNCLFSFLQTLTTLISLQPLRTLCKWMITLFSVRRRDSLGFCFLFHPWAVLKFRTSYTWVNASGFFPLLHMREIASAWKMLKLIVHRTVDPCWFHVSAASVYMQQWVIDWFLKG